MLLSQKDRECLICYENFDLNKKIPMQLECSIALVIQKYFYIFFLFFKGQHDVCKECIEILFKRDNSINCPMRCVTSKR